jgi:hypothetical protein
MKPRRIVIASAATLALAGSANAAPKHTWFMLHYDTATCDISTQTPEEFQSLTDGPLSHMQGIATEIIEPTDVEKFGDGSIHVRIRATRNGEPGYYYDLFTTKEMCDIWVKGVKPKQAPHDDIN